MAKESKIAREKKVMHLVEKYKEKRAKLVEILKDSEASYEDREKAQLAISKLPRNSSKTRLRNRCAETGRPRGYYRKFGLCRNMVREYLMKGYIPGGRKASW